ncbi:MAG: hypothetical protein RL210_2190 [Pseudomonadota bacterium]
MLAALGHGVQGSKWHSLIDKVYRPAVLQAAWQRVRRNKGAAGVDRISIQRFESQKQRYLDELHAELKTGQYQAHPVKRIEIPKGDGKTRPLGIPTVKDRVVQAAVKSVIEPIFEAEFLPMSYGFRPGRGCKDALREVSQYLAAGYHWVVDADIQGYFDNIPHQTLMQQLQQRISDGRLLSLIEHFLKQDIMADAKRWTPTQGTPQGAVLSPLLANLYLHPLDVLMQGEDMQMIRYADDFVVLCKTQQAAARALAQIRKWTEQNGLTLHPDKTHLGNCLEAGQGFEFLGYRFEAGRRTVRRKSMNRLREAIRQRTRRTSGKSIERIIAELNPVLRGWFGYFKHARHGVFGTVDAFVRRRLRSILLKRNKGSGVGNSTQVSFRWKNAYFAERGLFTLKEAHALASQSR